MDYGKRYLNKLSRQYGKVRAARETISEFVNGDYLSYIADAPPATQRELLRKLKAQAHAMYEATIVKYEARNLAQKLRGKGRFRLEDMVEKREKDDNLHELEEAVSALKTLRSQADYVDDRVHHVAEELDRQINESEGLRKGASYYLLVAANAGYKAVSRLFGTGRKKQ
jgi:hypothetical protein